MMVITNFLFIFAVEITGFGHLVKGGFSTSPFSFWQSWDNNKKVESMPKKLTREEFIERATAKHNGKYDYSGLVYVNADTKVEIKCPEHGTFYQIAHHHLKGRGCPLCGVKSIWDKRRRMTTEDFVKKARAIHGDYYIYDKVDYKGTDKKVWIKCPKHGYFSQVANTHLSGHGCIKCKGDKIKSLKNKGAYKFIKDAIEVHGNRYDYSKVVYKTNKDKVTIICPKHGEFNQTPNTHLRGCGCPKCADEKTGDRCRLTFDAIIEHATKIHNGKYDYSKSKASFRDIHTDMQIMCPKHGEFWQKPKNHLAGHGCPICKMPIGEKKIATLLTRRGIDFVRQQPFPNNFLFCTNKLLYVDFYLPEHKAAIEYNGEQHYKEHAFFHKHNSLTQQQERDNAVRDYCRRHKIKLIEIPYWDYDNIEQILSKELSLTT